MQTFQNSLRKFSDHYYFSNTRNIVLKIRNNYNDLQKLNTIKVLYNLKI